MRKLILIATVAALAATTEAAALRRLSALTVTEGASVEFSAERAVGLKTSNSAIATVMPPDGGRSVVSGVRIGTAEITFNDVRGPFAVLPVNVVPPYWEALAQFFEDDPEIRLVVSGDKVIITGQTANPDTLSRVEQAVKFDSDRILTQVSYSTASVAQLVKNYLAQIGHTNISVSCVGRNICLKGKLFDQKAIDLVKLRAQEFLKPFAGIGVNTDGLRIIKQRIILTAEFLEYNVAQARNLGINWPTAITLEGTFDYGWDWSRETTGNNSDNRTFNGSGNSSWNRSGSSSTSSSSGSSSSSSTSRSSGSSSSGSSDSSFERVLNDALDKSSKQTMKSKVAVSGVNATINLLKHNGAGKTLYKTSLATQSGEEVEFQNGGTLTFTTEGTFSGGDSKEIEYGFLVKATPTIIDATSVNLALSLDNKTEPEYKSADKQDYDLKRYQTKSTYIVRPGETIVMSGFNGATSDVGKDGLPFLSHIPGIGPWLFGNRQTEESQTEMLLVVTVNWALENESETSVKARDELKEMSADVEMP